MRFATRLNSFASMAEAAWPGQKSRPTVRQMIERAASVAGLSDVDLNYPDHLADGAAETAKMVLENGLSINGLAMRYYTNPAFRRGAFTNPDPNVRREAIDLTKRGIDAAREAGSNLMTIWLGQDGFDYAFQVNYAALWDYTIEAFREVCAHDPACQISIEYKPNEPRAFALMPDCATTLLAIHEIGRPNVGVTLDMAHALYANEQPACAAAQVARHSKLLGVHLNDGNAKRDDGLMAGAVHLLQTIELLRQIAHDGYRGAIYFDTFPDASGVDPIAECAANIATVKRLMGVVERLDGDNRLAEAIRLQDPVASQTVVQEMLFGGTGQHS